jgi:hypothetical protein
MTNKTLAQSYLQFSFYRDIDFIPTEDTLEVAERAVRDAGSVLEMARKVITD